MMQTFNTIEEFNNYSSDHLRKYTIKEYVDKVHNIFNKELDISFMEYFTEIIKHRNEFFIHHNKLKKYGVINDIKSV